MFEPLGCSKERNLVSLKKASLNFRCVVLLVRSGVKYLHGVSDAGTRLGQERVDSMKIRAGIEEGNERKFVECEC